MGSEWDLNCTEESKLEETVEARWRWLIGKIDEFDRSVEDWVSYTERMEQYFVANGLEADMPRREQSCWSYVSINVPAYQELGSAALTVGEDLYEELVQLVKDRHDSLLHQQ